MKASGSVAVSRAVRLGGALLICFGLAGCPQGEVAPVAGAPLDAKRDETPVVVVPYGAGYVATQVVSFSGDAAGASRAVVDLATSVGDVLSAPGASGWRIDVTLQGSGSTEDEARRALATMAVGHAERLRKGTLELSARVAFEDYQPPQDSGGVEVSTRSASVQAMLPAGLAYALRHNTDVGNASSSGLSGSLAQLHGEVGDVGLDGDWREVEATTRVGTAYAALALQGDADVLLATEVGDAEVALAGPVEGGFDLFGSTQLGSVTILVHGTEPVGTPSATEAHYRTPGYEGLSPKVRVQGYSRIGSVLIHG